MLMLMAQKQTQASSGTARKVEKRGIVVASSTLPPSMFKTTRMPQIWFLLTLCMTLGFCGTHLYFGAKLTAKASDRPRRRRTSQNMSEGGREVPRVKDFVQANAAAEMVTFAVDYHTRHHGTNHRHHHEDKKNHGGHELHKKEQVHPQKDREQHGHSHSKHSEQDKKNKHKDDDHHHGHSNQENDNESNVEGNVLAIDHDPSRLENMDKKKYRRHSKSHGEFKKNMRDNDSQDQQQHDSGKKIKPLKEPKLLDKTLYLAQSQRQQAEEISLLEKQKQVNQPPSSHGEPNAHPATKVAQHDHDHDHSLKEESKKEEHSSKTLRKKGAKNDSNASRDGAGKLKTHDIKDDDSLMGDVSALLDFAIVGFSKAATTHIMHWLRQQDTVISMGHDEMCYLNKKQGSELVQHLQSLDETKLRGFKCPGHFSLTSLDWYPQHFPQTKLIVGLRHPVSWFQSFYNYRTRHPKFENALLPGPETMVGRCTREMQGVCTDHAKFHLQLARLGKTALNSTERALLQMDSRDLKGLGSRRVPNSVFLYEISQLSNPRQEKQLAADLAHFLGLKEPLKPFVAAPVENNIKDNKTTPQFSLCQPKYDDLRTELMKTAVESSEWILAYFLDHVHLSSRDSFISALKGWKQDPCLAQTS